MNKRLIKLSIVWFVLVLISAALIVPLKLDNLHMIAIIVFQFSVGWIAKTLNDERVQQEQ